MSTVRRITWVVHVLALALWMAALAGSAIAAMNVFPTMDDLPLALADYPDYPAAHHPRLAASRVMEGVFVTGDLLQIVAAALVVLTLLVQLVLLGAAARRPAHVVRTVAIAIATLLLAFHVAAVAPTMYGELRAWWQDAGAGRTDDAEVHRAAFNALHPAAEQRQGTTLLLVLVALAAGVSALAAPRRDGAPRPDRLQTPRLARTP